MNKFEIKLRRQILKSTLLLVGIFIICFLAFMFYSRTYATRNLLIENNDNIEEEFLNIESQIDSYINKIDISVFAEANQTPQVLYTTYYGLLKQSDLKFDISVFNSLKENIFSSNKFSEHAFLDETYEKLLIDLYNKNQTRILSYYNDDNYTLFIRELDHDYLIIKLNSFELATMIHSKTVMYAILDDSNQIISSNNYDLASNLSKYSFDLEANKINLNGQSYSQAVKYLNNDYKVVSLEFENDNINFLLIVITTIVLSAFMIIILSYYSTQLSKNTSKNLANLLREIKQIRKGDLNYRVLMKSDDEFEIIAREINKMLDEITSLNNRNSELIDLQRIIQIRELEAQFNPHFLYNTLETIRYSILVKPQQASKLIIQLNKILRYSISNNVKDVRIKEDIEYVKAYLNINKIRFNKRLEYFIDIDEACLDLLVPKLIVQPLIENSIKHNFKVKDHLSIWITINIIENHLVITVEDNGDGMDEKELVTLRYNFNKDINDGKSIGMYNVNKRLKLLYGDDSTVQIESRKGVGTIVSLSIKLNDV